MIKYFAVTFFLIGFFALQLQAQEVRKITIQEAVKIALENNFQLKQAENNLSLASELIKSERADFLPNVNSSLNGSRNTGQQFIADRFSEGLDPFVNITSQSISGNLSANLVLFQGFNNVLTLRASESQKVSREESLNRARENIIFTTASRYLQVLLDVELLNIAKENLATSQKQLEQIQAQVEVGSRPTVDLFNQEAQVANNELTVTQRENAFKLNKLLLVRQLQIDPLVEYEFVLPEFNENRNFSAESGFNVRELVNQALLTRSDYKGEIANIEGLRLQETIAKNSLLPTLSASASLSSRYSDQLTDRITSEKVPFGDQFFDQQINRSVGVSFSLPIFQRWNRMYQIESARIQLKNAKLGLENTELQIIQEVTQAINDYSSNVKQLESAEKSFIASERAFLTQQERYNVGASTLIELSQAQSNFVSAQSNQTQALYNLIFQEKLLDFYLGKLSGDNLEF